VLCEPAHLRRARRDQDAQTVCYDVLREILREARQFGAREYRILARKA